MYHQHYQMDTNVLYRGVLLTDAVAAPQSHSTILRYSNSQPPALYYHTSSPVVESQQNEVGKQLSIIF